MLIRLGEALLYILAALCLFAAVNTGASAVGYGMENLLHKVPYLISLFSTIALLFVYHLVYRQRNPKKKATIAFVNGTILAIVSFLTFLLDIFFYSRKIYTGVLMNGPTFLFPLDGTILSFLLFGIGGFFICRSFRYAKEIPAPSSLPTQQKGWRIAFSILVPVFTLIGLYFFGGFLLGVTTWCLTPYLWGILCFYLLMLLPAVMSFFYEFIYAPCEDPVRRKKFLKIGSLVFLNIVAVLVILLLICLCLYPNTLIDGAAPLLPIDLMMSLNIGPLLLILADVLAPILAMLTFLVKAKNTRTVPN
jgi:hypothetical protein